MGVKYFDEESATGPSSFFIIGKYKTSTNILSLNNGKNAVQNECYRVNEVKYAYAVFGFVLIL